MIFWMSANIVILADGVNSMLGRSLDMVPVSSAHRCRRRKELIRYSPALDEERFNLASHEGVARLFAGAPSNGLMVCRYTNRDSVSLGLVCGTGDIAHATKSSTANAGNFKQHPAIRPARFRGAVANTPLIWCPKGGIAMMPELANDGVMIVTATPPVCCLNLGYTCRPRHGFSHRVRASGRSNRH